VLDENGNVLAFAGDGSKIHSVEMPPEITESNAALSGPVGKALAAWSFDDPKTEGRGFS